MHSRREKHKKNIKDEKNNTAQKLKTVAVFNTQFYFNTSYVIISPQLADGLITTYGKICGTGCITYF